MNDNNLNDDEDLPKLPLPKSGKTPEKHRGGLSDKDLAVNLIRDKLKGIYDSGPTAEQELEEAKINKEHLSKHQKYIHNLQNSGKSMVEIQTEWHEYYVALPDDEKNRVWQEFYAANKQTRPSPKHTQPSYKVNPETNSSSEPRVIAQQFMDPEEIKSEKKTAADIKSELLGKVQRRTDNSWYRRFHSLLFGVGLGSLVLFIFLFSFFNDRFIAPFITPSRSVSAQSLIVNPNGQALSPNPLIIIPKINVEIPVIYTVPTIDENDIENNLEDGVVHFPTTAYPGQNGNGAIFGHSSNNILNPGKYKFAFVLLHTLQDGDTFTIDYQDKAYVYQIFEKEIVSPNDVSVLNNIPGHPATFTLITCDPPGTSINRLVVVGDQISPSPSTNTAGPDQNTAAKPAILPSNSPSLWSRIVNWF